MGGGGDLNDRLRQMSQTYLIVNARKLTEYACASFFFPSSVVSMPVSVEFEVYTYLQACLCLWIHACRFLLPIAATVRIIMLGRFNIVLSISRQLEQLNIDQPDKPVMLAVFGSELFVKGGGKFTKSQRNSRFSNCERATYDDLINKGKEMARNYQLKPLSESYV